MESRRARHSGYNGFYTVEMIGFICPHYAFSLVPVSFLSSFDILSLSDSNAML